KNPFDVVGRIYDGVDHVVVDGVHETVLDTGESDHSLAALGEVAQITCDVAANLNLHGGLGEVDIAAVGQCQGRSVPHNPRDARSYCYPKVSRSDVIREVAEDGQCSADPCRTPPRQA